MSKPLKSYLTKNTVIMGIFCAIVAMIWPYTPFLQYQWLVFIMLPFFYLTSTEIKQIPGVVCCTFAGILWGVADLALCNFMASINCHPFLISIIGIGAVTTIACYVHMVLLASTFLNKTGVILAVFGITCHLGAQEPIAMAINFSAGGILCLACVFFTNLWQAPPAAETEEVEQVKKSA